MGRAQQERIVAVIREHAASLLRIARNNSLCADDAHDAYQLALEIYLQHYDLVDHATVGPWLRTVCKREALRIRATRQRVVSEEAVDWDAREALETRDADERASALERVARAAEALH